MARAVYRWYFKMTDSLSKFELAIETSGVYPLTGNWHWICFSPKKFKKPTEEIYKQAHELKVVVYNQHDLKWAQEHADKVNSDCLLYLQPEWEREQERGHPLIPLYPQVLVSPEMAETVRGLAGGSGTGGSTGGGGSAARGLVGGHYVCGGGGSSGYSGGGFAFNSGQIGTFTLCSVDEPYIWYYHNDAAVFITVTDTLTPC